MTLSPLTASDLSSLPNISHGFFTRQGGVSEGIYASLNLGLGSNDESACVVENRRRVAEYFGVVPAQLCTLYQIHSSKVAVVETPWQVGNQPEADALVTKNPEIILGILTADCAPILLADAEAGVIGAAHAGWKGAMANIGGAVVEAMEKLGAVRGRIIAAVGPCIAQKSYEVDSGFREQFLVQSPGHAEFFAPSPSKATHWHFNLPSYVQCTLEKAGVARVNLLANDTCFEENAFFSYRRKTLRAEPDYGRQVSAIMLRP